ncbi:MAG: hypothetical protein V3T98_00935 [Candidatus Paceibacterota bacterium]
MDEQFSTTSTASGIDKFKLGKKWFWIGIVMAFLNVLGGLIYGVVLAIEKNHRKEGLIIITWAVVWALIGFLIIGPWLVKSGIVPQFELIR